MAKKSDLMGLGLPFALAARMANDINIITTNAAASFASALATGGDSFFNVIQGSGSGYVALPQVGGPGCLLGDIIAISNQAANSVIVVAYSTAYQLNLAAGSVTGTTGISVSAGVTIEFCAVSASTWIGFKNV